MAARFGQLLFIVVCVRSEAAPAAAWTHGWDTVAGQLAANVGTWNAALNTTGLWEWMAQHYSAIALNDW